MSHNLIEAVQRHLAYANLERESPNTEHLSAKGALPHPEKLDQACISAVLAGIYQYTREEKDAGNLLVSKHQSTWLEVIFKKYPIKLEEKIIAYTGSKSNLIRQRLFAVAEKAVQEIKKVVGEHATGRDVKRYMTGQRLAILTRLPSGLNVGKLVNNNSLDDATNKMHGPFSDFMHWVETILAEPQRPLY